MNPKHSIGIDLTMHDGKDYSALTIMNIETGVVVGTLQGEAARALSEWMEYAAGLSKERDRLALQVRTLNRYIERAAFCPDCRDKLDGECWRCRAQKTEDRS